MADIAHLGIAVDSTQVRKADKDLDALSMAAANAEKRTVALSRSARMAANQQKILAFQLNDVAVSLASGMNPMMVAIQQGSQMAQIYQGEGGLTKALSESVKMIVNLASKLRLLIGVSALVTGGMALFTRSLNEGREEAASMGDVMLATFQVIRDKIYDLLQPAINAISPWISSALDLASSAFVWFGNHIIKIFMKAYEYVKALWNNFPDLLSDVFKIAFFRATNRIAVFLQDGLRKLNSWLDAADKLIQSWGGSGISGRFDPQMIQLPEKPELSEAGNELLRRLEEIDATNYMGKIGDAIANRVTTNLEAAAEAADGAGKKIDRVATSNLPKLAAAQEQVNDKLEANRSVFQGFFQDLRDGMRDGENFWQSFLKAAQNALNKIMDRMLDMATNQLFMSLFGGSTGAPINLLGNPLAPKAMGGPVSGNTPYIVGERGPELFIPNSAGRISPNGQMGGNTVVNITNNSGGDVTENRSRRGNTEFVDIIVGTVNKAAGDGRLDGGMSRFGVTPQAAGVT